MRSLQQQRMSCVRAIRAYPGEASCSLCTDLILVAQIWQANIRGTGQIVGCGDTGLDVDSCMFWDSSSASGNPGPSFYPDVDVPCSHGSTAHCWPQVSTTHRKIVSYNSWADAADDPGTEHEEMDAMLSVKCSRVRWAWDSCGGIDPRLDARKRLVRHQLLPGDGTCCPHRLL